MGNCTRRRVEISGENYYILVGNDFVMGTVPRENDPIMSETRKIVELICEEITEIMQLRSQSCETLQSPSAKQSKSDSTSLSLSPSPPVEVAQKPVS